MVEPSTPHRWPDCPTLSVVALVMSAATYGASLTIADPDLWGHVRFGLDILETGRIVHADPYSYLTGEQPWINHEWLAEVVFYLLYRAGGFPLLTLFAAALITAGWSLTWRLTRGNADDKFIWIGLAVISSAGWW